MWIFRRQTMKPKMQRRPASLLGSSLDRPREIYLRAPRSQAGGFWMGGIAAHSSNDNEDRPSGGQRDNKRTDWAGCFQTHIKLRED